MITPDQAQASIADTMDKGRRFLLLAGSIGVVLAGIALALASHHFASGTNQAGGPCSKAGEFQPHRVRNMYFQQSLWMGLGGSLAGLVIGGVVLFHLLLLFIVSDWLPIALPAAGPRPWITGLATGLICLAGFTLPALWHLPAQSPLVVLRQDAVLKPLSSAVRIVLGVGAIAGLLLWYSNNLYLSLAILVGFGVTALASILAGLFLLRLGKQYGPAFR